LILDFEVGFAIGVTHSKRVHHDIAQKCENVDSASHAFMTRYK